MMSALLQSYMQDVFEVCAEKALPTLTDADVWKAYWKDMNGWGNPSADNVKRLFPKFGVDDVIAWLSWQKCDNATVRSRLNHLNHVRNSIAHGAEVRHVNCLVKGAKLANDVALIASERTNLIRECKDYPVPYGLLCLPAPAASRRSTVVTTSDFRRAKGKAEHIPRANRVGRVGGALLRRPTLDRDHRLLKEIELGRFMHGR